jgi:hypothetical protein
VAELDLNVGEGRYDFFFLENDKLKIYKPLILINFNIILN